MFDLVTFPTKQFCQKNEGFSKREFFITEISKTDPVQ